MTRSNFMITLAVLTMITALTGCGLGRILKPAAPPASSPSASIKNGVVKHPQLGFEITFPTTWLLTDHPPTPAAIQGTRMLEGIAKSGASIRVKVLNLAPGSTLDSFTTTAMQGADKMLKNFELTGDEQFKIGADNAHKFTFYFDGATTNERTRTESYTLINGSRGYIITTATIKEDADKYAKDIDATVQSFKLLKN